MAARPGIKELCRILGISLTQLAAVQALDTTELGFLDGVTAGTATASKAVVLGAYKDIATITSATITTLTSNSLVMGTAAGGLVLKRGANGKCGTFVCDGTTPVTVNNTSIAITDTIVISLNTVGGTVGAVPAVKTITAASGFTVAGTASDTSTYNYAIISNAA